MSDEPDSGYPSARDTIPDTSTPMRPGNNPSIKEHLGGLDLAAINAEESIEHGELSPDKKSKPSKAKIDVNIRRAIAIERGAIATSRLNRSRESQNSSADSSRIQDVRFDISGRPAIVDEVHKTIQTTLDEHEQLLNKNKALEQKISTLKEELRKKDQENSLKVNEITLLNQQKLNALSEELDNERVRNQDLEKQFREKCEEENNEKQVLEKSLFELNEQIKHKDYINQSLLTEKTILNQHLKATEQEKLDLQKELDFHRNYAEEHKQNLDQFLASYEEVKKKLKDSEDSEKNLFKENAELRADIKVLQNQEEEAKKEIEKRLQEISDFKEREERLEKELDALQDEVEKLDNDYKKELKKNELLLLNIIDQNILAADLKDVKGKLEICEKEKEAALKNVEDLEKEMSLKNKKISDLEETSKLLSQKEVESSSKFNGISKEYNNKLKDFAKVSEEVSILKEKLLKSQEANEKLRESHKQNIESASKLDELKVVNEKFSQEIEYLRNENKEKEGIRQEFRKLQEELEIIRSELSKKTAELVEVQEKCTNMSDVFIKSKEIQIELDKRIESTKEQEFTIVTLQRNIDSLQKKYDEKEERYENLLDEYGRYQQSKNEEIQNLLIKYREVTNNYNELQLRLQENLAICSTVWDNLPDTLKAQLPSEVEEALKSLKIGREDALSVADSQHSNQLDEYKHLSEEIERYCATNLNSTDIKYNIFQLVSKLIRNYKHHDNSAAIEFTHSLGQIIDRIENKYKDMKNELEKVAIEERKSKREYHKKYQDSEMNYENEKSARIRAENIVTDLRAQISVLGSKTTTDKKGIEMQELKEELERLKGVEVKYSQLTEQCLKTVTKEYEAELDKKHDEELRLHERIRFAEADAENIKRKLASTETRLLDMTLENDKLKHSLLESETLAHKASKLQKKYDHELETKRYNQETIKKCFGFIEMQKGAIDHLKERNHQRQKVLEKIYKDLTKINSKQVFQEITENNINILEQWCSKWDSEEKKQNAEMDEYQSNFNKILRERTTSDVVIAFQAAQADYNKENL